jgi:hypothetical protein
VEEIKALYAEEAKAGAAWLTIVVCKQIVDDCSDRPYRDVIHISGISFLGLHYPVIFSVI